MKKLLLANFIIIMQYTAAAQGVAINNNGATAHSSAILDISSVNKGLLIPRIPFLTDAKDKLTILNPAKGLLIHSKIAGINGTDEGFYYNSGTSDNPEWQKLAVVAPSTDWSLSGNAGTDPLLNFIGTTDDKNLVFKRNKEEAMQIYSGGAVVFTGNETGSTPVQGIGSRMMWIPAKSAFRVGGVTGIYKSYWNDENIGKYSFTAGMDNRGYGEYSTAFGRNVVAAGKYSYGAGAYTTASEIASFATGYISKATGFYATAMGRETLASGDTSTAIGYKTIASGNTSTAMGSETEATFTNSTAIGYKTKASAYVSTALGSNTIASGHISTAMGGYTVATGQLSTAMNYATYANGHRSTTMGSNTVSNYYTGVAMGEFNEDIGEVKSQGTNNDRLLQIGNGKSEDKRSDALYVKRNGDLVIAGSLTENSDIRLKENMVPLKKVLDKITAIQPITYYFKDKQLHPASHQVGFSAQEVQQQFPELVNADEKGYLSVSYTKMTAVLMQAIKEQQNIIEAQQTSISEQKKINTILNIENNDIKKRLEELEKIILTKK